MTKEDLIKNILRPVTNFSSALEQAKTLSIHGPSEDLLQNINTISDSVNEINKIIKELTAQRDNFDNVADKFKKELDRRAYKDTLLEAHPDTVTSNHDDIYYISDLSRLSDMFSKSAETYAVSKMIGTISAEEKCYVDFPDAFANHFTNYDDAVDFVRAFGTIMYLRNQPGVVKFSQHSVVYSIYYNFKKEQLEIIPVSSATQSYLSGNVAPFFSGYNAALDAIDEVGSRNIISAITTLSAFYQLASPGISVTETDS